MTNKKYKAGQAGGRALLKKYGRAHFVRIGKLGFQALVVKYFHGDREQAKRFIAARGKAHYFKHTRPRHARRLMRRYAGLKLWDLKF